MMDQYTKRVLCLGLFVLASSFLEMGSHFVQAAEGCAPATLGSNTGDQGLGRVFVPDPQVGARNENLLPSSGDLDSFATQVTLLHLNQNGVLSGSYVDVTDDQYCMGKYGAFDSKNQFIYPYGDPRFQEVMTY